MSTVQCPYCGEVMNAPLKFCTSCGRGVSQADLKKVGGLRVKPPGGKKAIFMGEEEEQDFSRSRGDFQMHRKMRTFFLTTSMVLIVLMGYYVAMKYVFKQKFPYNADVLVEQFLKKGMTAVQSGKLPELQQSSGSEEAAE